jgi:glycosyltransferase involved in cell wall biosynthesis
MHHPSVSAIVTAYNSAGYVHRAIESILAQTSPAGEVHVVDDGSQDGTADVVEARFGDRVRVVRQENAGPNGARRSACSPVTPSAKRRTTRRRGRSASA